MTVININILVYYYFKTKQTKQNRQQTLKIQKHPSARQTTNQRSSNATIPRKFLKSVNSITKANQLLLLRH